MTSTSFCKESALGPVLGVSVAALSLRYQSQDSYTGTLGQDRSFVPNLNKYDLIPSMMHRSFVLQYSGKDAFLPEALVICGGCLVWRGRTRYPS